MTAEQRASSGQPAQPAGNIVYVSKKGVMAYVLAVVTQFNAGAKEVTLKARGKVISRAVDAAEIVKNKFLQDVSIKSIKTSTEDMKTASGAPTKVSTIEIVLARNPGSSAELKL
ncbi:MAG: DNA-binding protein Alba [Candidatus Micrarchaeota archaeon]|nr:DNA-binding protein Alba [Candidatus Micrarchaeota archaeon]